MEINWGKYIKAEDLSETDVRIDYTNVNISRAGEYIIKAKAEDIGGNKVEKDIKVTVKDRPVNMVDYAINVDKKAGKVVVAAVNGEADNINRNGASSGNTPSYSRGSSVSRPAGNQESPTAPPGGDEQTGNDSPPEGGTTEPTEPSGGDGQTDNDNPPEENTNGNTDVI